jgi:hypothetical protein
MYLCLNPEVFLIPLTLIWISFFERKLWHFPKFLFTHYSTDTGSYCLHYKILAVPISSKYPGNLQFMFKHNAMFAFYCSSIYMQHEVYSQHKSALLHEEWATYNSTHFHCLEVNISWCRFVHNSLMFSLPSITLKLLACNFQYVHSVNDLRKNHNCVFGILLIYWSIN